MPGCKARSHWTEGRQTPGRRGRLPIVCRAAGRHPIGPREDGRRGGVEGPQCYAELQGAIPLDRGKMDAGAAARALEAEPIVVGGLGGASPRTPPGALLLDLARRLASWTSTIAMLETKGWICKICASAAEQLRAPDARALAQVTQTVRPARISRSLSVTSRQRRDHEVCG